MTKAITKNLESEEKRQAELAHKRREKILKLKRIGAVAWLELGRQLYLVEKNEDWKTLGGDGFPNMSAYMTAPEASGGLDLTRSWLVKIKLNYEKFVKELCASTHKIALLEPAKLAEVRRIITKDNLEEWLEKVKQLSLRDIRMEIRESFPPPPLEPIKGKYNVFVVDPPWPYGTEYDEEGRRVASPYGEQPIEKIKEWGIGEFKKSAHPKSVMWLWTTHQFLPIAFEILKDWEFNYKLALVWDKQKMGMGRWLRCQVEFCLLGVKGDYHKHWALEIERDIISSPRQEHSRKPKEFYEMVRRLCSGKRIDIFSREKHEGFEQYGNQINKY